MSLLDDLPAIISDATDDLLMATFSLRRPRGDIGDDGNATGPITVFSVRGLTDEFSSYRRQEAGIPDTDVKLLVLQYLSPTDPRSGDQIDVDLRRYLVLSVGQDPAKATWELHCRFVEDVGVAPAGVLMWKGSPLIWKGSYLSWRSA